MSSISSVELWAAAKFIGRECATVNKDYILCKQQAGADPAACAQQGELATACATKVVSDLKTRFPQEFAAFVKCLDDNDYRFDDCRSTKQALLNCWNNGQK